MLELDHFFVFTQPQAPEADDVIALGFKEGSRNVHPGQGTANRRIFCRNAMIEFLWVKDPAETETPEIAPMQFLARSNYRQSGYSPFGIGLRYRSEIKDEARSLPFDTWAYRPSYLPPHLQFEFAYTHLQEPLIFVLPFANTRPDTQPPEKRQPLDHPNQLQEITGLHITLPAVETLSPAMQALQEFGVATFTQDNTHLAEIAFDQAKQNQVADFRSQLSLLLHY